MEVMRGLALAGIGIAVALLSSCAMFQTPADTIKFDRGQFIAAYVEAHSAVSLLTARLRVACAERKLNPTTCSDVSRMADQARLINDQIMTAVRNPEVEIDWQAIATYIKLVAALASKAL